MSRRPLFVIRPEPETGVVTRQELLALAGELGLIDNDSVAVTIVGTELHLVLTPLGVRRLREAKA